MNSSSVFLLISIVYLSFCGISLANRVHPKDILENPKDECKNVCGKISTNITDSSCGDHDKRTEKILIVRDESDINDEKTEYGDEKLYECAAVCPENYKMYKTTNICVKDPVKFEKELEASRTDDQTTPKPDDKINEKLDYTWWIVGGVAGLLIVALIVAFVFIKSRSG